jgi:hypothetical protein
MMVMLLLTVPIGFVFMVLASLFLMVMLGKTLPVKLVKVSVFLN